MLYVVTKTSGNVCKSPRTVVDNLPAYMSATNIDVVHIFGLQLTANIKSWRLIWEPKTFSLSADVWTQRASLYVRLYKRL